ncbi:Rieske (2Fe-2S) protein [Streptomyces sp. ODS05-4]|uniref:Rieske (2Fe-2S) protein n=1 Tax=Streptomyces sp. ODS05-4 TaxID=2944939 RepID=UPI00210EA7B8|nr:Rieske (2Fe-2S) protein [Streptomyces sp. ODS05-4]
MTAVRDGDGRGADSAVARRTVVAAAGGAGLAAVLTACGGSGEGAAPATGVSSAAGGSAGPAGGRVIATTADVPRGGGTVVGDVVLTQPRPGEFRAFSAKCTHAGCAVKDVADGLIRCPCHGSAFDASDGSVRTGPATAPLPVAVITVDGSEIRLG